MQQLSEKTDCERNRTADDKQQKHSAALLADSIQRKGKGKCFVYETVNRLLKKSTFIAYGKSYMPMIVRFFVKNPHKSNSSGLTKHLMVCYT